MTEPVKRGPGRPRKNEQVQALADALTGVNTEPAPAQDVPPGPHTLEVRINGKIRFLQRVHSYHIDQQPHQAVITGALHPTDELND